MPTDAAARAPAPGSSAPPRAPQRSHRGLVITAIVAACLALVVVVAGVLSRAHQGSQLKTWTSAEEVPAVNLVSPTSQTGTQALVLPGNLQAFYNASIYPRVSGYVRAWYVDIGAHVKTGQLMATVDTPELDQQIEQARADLASAQANMQLARTTSERWARLLTQDAVSKQESDEKSGDLAVKTAQVNAAKANLDRLAALKSFARITAPFDGVVTARRVDIGALVNAGSGATTSSELFDVAKVDRLRLYVRVPQGDSARIGPGTTATLTVPEYPGRTFNAVLDTTSNAVSDTSGTLLVELMVDNADAALKAGDYAEVRFDIAGAAPGQATLRLPSSALLFRKSGMEAAVVGPDDRVHLRPVTIRRNLGATMEIASGLTASDRVIDNPPDSVAEGELVRVIPSDQAKPQHGAADAGG